VDTVRRASLSLVPEGGGRGEENVLPHALTNLTPRVVNQPVETGGGGSKRLKQFLE